MLFVVSRNEPFTYCNGWADGKHTSAQDLAATLKEVGELRGRPEQEAEAYRFTPGDGSPIYDQVAYYSSLGRWIHRYHQQNARRLMESLNQARDESDAEIAESLGVRVKDVASLRGVFSLRTLDEYSSRIDPDQVLQSAASVRRGLCLLSRIGRDRALRATKAGNLPVTVVDSIFPRSANSFHTSCVPRKLTRYHTRRFEIRRWLSSFVFMSGVSSTSLSRKAAG